MQAGVNGGPRIRAFVTNSGEVLSSGDYSALGIEQTGIFKVYKNGKLPEATPVPTKQTVNKFRIGFGTKTTDQKLAVNAFKHRKGFTTEPVVTPVLSQEFSPADIVKWEGIKAKTQGSSDIWALGYDGVNADKTLKVKYDHKLKKIVIKAWGQPIQMFNNNPTGVWQEEFVIDKDFCVDLCSDELCSEMDQDLFADKFLKVYNSRKWNADLPFSKFIKASKIRLTDPATPPISGLVASSKYCVSTCDDGSSSSLGQLQVQYPGYQILEEGRLGSISTYSMWRPNSAGAPALAVFSAPVSYATCGECPSGYVYTPGSKTVTVTRVLAPSDNISTGGTQQTYANTILNAYVPTKTFSGTTSAVSVANDTITITAHGLAAGTPVIYTNGGGTSIAGLTSGNTYYVLVTDANTIQLSETQGGTAIDITAAGTGASHTVKPVSSATFITNSGGNAVISITYPDTQADLVAINSDIVGEASISGAVCTPPAGTSVAWSVCGTASRAPKQWKITLADTVCGESRLAELQAAYTDLVVSELSPVGTCARAYTTTTYSAPVEPGCYPDEYSFYKPEAFESKIYWEEYSGELISTPDCEPAEPETPVCKAVGIIFEGGSFNKSVDDCLYGYYDYQPQEYTPVHFEVSVQDLDYTKGVECNPDELPVTHLRTATLIRGRGDYVRNVERQSNLDDGKIWVEDLAVSAALGASNFAAKQGEFYDEYTLTLKKDLSNNEGTGGRWNNHLVAYKWFVPTGNGKALENLINGFVVSLDKPDVTVVTL